jgi:hypothetical protein
MSNHNPLSEEWLDREDATSREDRLFRLDWIASRMPDVNYLRFFGGLTSKYLFEEARYCFVYAQFLAVIVLGLSYIEHTLAAMFYAAGRNELERASISTLLREAVRVGWITQAEFDNLDRAREIRNPVTHFRRPLHDDTVEYRAATQNDLPYNIIEEDAQHVMETVFHLLGKTAT